MEPTLHVLLVEDEEKLAGALKRGLGEEGMTVECAASAEAAQEVLKGGARFDVLALDVKLPGKDGFTFLRELRGGGDATPVLLLTARGALDDRVTGLNAGGDDYLVKPFAFAELVARLRALARRQARPPSPMLKVGDIELDTVRRRAQRGGRALSLSPKELMLLELLMRHAGQVVTRQMIAETVWAADYNDLTNLIEVFVNRLRQKLDPGGGKALVATVRGVGYTMRAE
jgi:two-component system, OmpR family, response regulator